MVVWVSDQLWRLNSSVASNLLFCNVHQTILFFTLVSDYTSDLILLFSNQITQWLHCVHLFQLQSESQLPPPSLTCCCFSTCFMLFQSYLFSSPKCRCVVLLEKNVGPCFNTHRKNVEYNILCVIQRLQCFSFTFPVGHELYYGLSDSFLLCTWVWMFSEEIMKRKAFFSELKLGVLELCSSYKVLPNHI